MAHLIRVQFYSLLTEAEDRKSKALHQILTRLNRADEFKESANRIPVLLHSDLAFVTLSSTGR